MEKEIKEIIEDIINNLLSYKKINEEVIQMMTYPENKKFFEGQSEGLLKAIEIINRKLVVLSF